MGGKVSVRSVEDLRAAIRSAEAADGPPPVVAQRAEVAYGPQCEMMPTGMGALPKRCAADEDKGAGRRYFEDLQKVRPGDGGRLSVGVRAARWFGF